MKLAICKMYVDLRVGQSLNLDNGNVVVTLEKKSGQCSRLKIEAAATVKVVLPQKDGGNFRLASGYPRISDAQERVVS